MYIRLGFQIAYRLAQPTPMVAMLDIHDSHAGRIVAAQDPWTSPQLPLHRYRDRFGNTCTRLLAPAGLLVLRGDALVRAEAPYERPRVAGGPMPEDVRLFLAPSRYCEIRPLQRQAHLRFGDLRSDRLRVQAICAHVARSLAYVEAPVDCSRGALQALQEGEGSCRDFAHAAITLCRAVGIPARYCAGFPPAAAPGSRSSAGFTAWFEAWVEGQWQAFDARSGGACPARIPVARGRDAADAATSCAFGPCEPELVEVWALEEQAARLPQAEAAPAAFALAS